MEHQTAAVVVSKLEDAIDKVLEGTGTIARVSKRQFEEYVQLLTSARLGIYVSLHGIYAEHPDLSPKTPSEAEESEDDLPVKLEMPSRDRPLDARTLEKVRDLFRNAYQLVGEVQAAMRMTTTASSDPERSTGLPTLGDAAAALERVLARLPSVPEGST
jgi:hypothetical protein